MDQIFKQISPYISDASRIVGSAAGLASVVPGRGLGKISSGASELAKRQHAINQRQKSRIEANKLMKHHYLQTKIIIYKINTYQ